MIRAVIIFSLIVAIAITAFAQGVGTWRLYVNGVSRGTYSSLEACQTAGRTIVIAAGGGTYNCVRLAH